MPILETTCPLDCPDSCSLEVHIEDGQLRRIEGTRGNPYTQGFICSKVRGFSRHQYGLDRVRTPLLRSGARGGEQWQTLTWAEAYSLMIEKIGEARTSYGGEAILPLSYGGSNGLLTHGCLDERLFRRLGASRLLRTVCAAPSTSAAKGLYGRMVGTALDDYSESRLIVVWGNNPSVSGIHLVPVIKAAREKGAQLIVIDPRTTPLAKQADLHLPLLPGTDLVVALALIREFFERGTAADEFLSRHAEGAAELRQRALPWTLERAAATAGLETADLQRFYELYAATSPAVIRCGWGLERNRNGGSAVSAVLALPAVAGKFGVRGGGYTLSNGDAWKHPPQLGDLVLEPEPPTRAVNMNRLGEALEELDAPPIKVLFVHCANPLATLPNQERLRRALARQDLFVVVFDQVMTDTAQYADLVLPATTFLEHDDIRPGYGTLTMGRVRPVLAPEGEAQSSVEVFGELLRRFDLHREGEPLEAHELITRLLPAAKQHENRWQPSCGAQPVQFVDTFARTASGKIDLLPAALDQEAPDGLYAYREAPGSAKYPLALISPATSSTISSTFGQLSNLMAKVEINVRDAASRGISEGQAVRLWNDLGEVRCFARITTNIRPGVAMLPKGLWGRSTLSGNTANAVAPDHLADLGGGACFNDARVEIAALGR